MIRVAFGAIKNLYQFSASNKNTPSTVEAWNEIESKIMFCFWNELRP